MPFGIGNENHRADASFRKGGDANAPASQTLVRARSPDADAEMIFPENHGINFRANCLACHRALGSATAPISQKDGMAVSIRKGIKPFDPAALMPVETA